MDSQFLTACSGGATCESDLQRPCSTAWAGITGQKAGCQRTPQYGLALGSLPRHEKLDTLAGLKGSTKDQVKNQLLVKGMGSQSSAAC